MKKITLLKIINISLLFSFFLQVISVICLVAPVGNRLAGIMYTVHGYNGFVMIGLVFVHLILNWGWIKMHILKKKGV